MTPTPYTTDSRRAIPRHIWLTNRARNALQRPAFIGAISVATFVTAIVSVVVVPRTQRQPAPVIQTVPRPDTLSPIATAAEARTQMLRADSLLASARQQMAALTPAPATDSAAPMDSVLRDSVQARVAAIDGALDRAQQAPLPASYKAIAELPELRGDARIHALVDSLNEIEREREGFGAVGGVDPIFVALTSRARDVGRAIQSLAVSRREALRAQIGAQAAPVAQVATAPAIDTIQFVTQRDSARAAFQQANDSLKSRRAESRALDIEEERARERASAVPPTLALLASAFVLSAVIGFAAALMGELRRPRVSDGAELERLLGLRVLSTVEATMPSMERGRRQADRAAPTYFDPGAEAYQLAYLGLATEHPALLTASVTGDDAAVAAVVACNLAAVAADEARNTLVLDLDPACMAAGALQARPRPGVSDIVHGDASWPDATVAARVGRDKTVDLVPAGLGSAPSVDQIRALLARDGSRLARYYDAVFAIVAPQQAQADALSALPSCDLVYCARPGVTALRTVREHLDGVRTAGGRVRGVVLWNAERPTLPTPRESAERSRDSRAPLAEPEMAQS
jgi:hypothetical protein